MANANEIVNPEPKIEEQPTPQISGKPAGQAYEPASGSGVTLEAVEQLLDRKLQSIKDTRLGKMEAKLTDLEGAFAAVQQLKAAGMSDADAQSKVLGEKRIQDLESQIQSLKSGKEVPATSPGGGKQLLTETQAKILSSVGLTAKDPRFTQFLRDNPTFSSNEEYFAALDRQALVWQAEDVRKPQPGPMSVAQTVSSVPAGDGSYTKEKYKADMLAARGKPDELRRVKEAARKDGVDVDNIGFV